MLVHLPLKEQPNTMVRDVCVYGAEKPHSIPGKGGPFLKAKVIGCVCGPPSATP